MPRASYPRAPAARLAESARHIAIAHGDFRAQTVAYALLLRRWDPSADVTGLLDDFDDSRAIGRVEEALDSMGLDALRARYESEGKDPAVYFYEEFLRAYDPISARGRGTLYTPPEVVSCIVRGVDWVLRERFGSTLGDALVVDPCCGVGTFLLHIEQHTDYHPRLMGMELMPAPCKIARCLLREANIIEADWLSDTPIDAGGRALVILGNPPYSGHSSNPYFDKLSMLRVLMADYREGLGERNPKWLQDDYVKFIRMAQHRIERAGQGVLAFITNHSYLFNPTFRTMRQSLARTFDEILVLDLGGNVKRMDKQDENVFPIQMGVAISFFIKVSRSADCVVRYAIVAGKKRDKLNTLAGLDLGSVAWTDVPLAEPFHIFVPQDNSLREEFYGFASLFDIFREHTMGFVTSRDRVAIGFTKDEVLARVDSAESDNVIEVLYRPFDRRWACYSRTVMERPRLPFMQNLMRDNLALAVGRAGQVTGSDEWDVVFVTDRPADLNLFRRGGAKLFPRYVYQWNKRVSNMRVGDDQDALFAYIYALLHSRAYRTRYAEFLAIDYPRVPMPRDVTVPRALAELGERLIDAHLMRPEGAGSPRTPRRFAGDPKRRQAAALQITIGGYREPEKCMKDRAGVDAREAEEAVWSAVATTLEIQAEIDRVVAGDPPW